MRQLGVRPSELEPVETDTGAPSGILPHERFAVEAQEPAEEPYRVEVYRIEGHPIASTPVEPPQEKKAASRRPSPPPHPERPEAGGVAAATGRWEEFREPHRLGPEHGGRSRLDSVPPLQSSSWGLLSADREPERRSSFLTLAVPGIAALLAVGAFLWSGLLRDRLRQQDAAMSALQEQNQKLSDTVAKMNDEHQAPGVPTADASQNPGTGPSSEPAAPVRKQQAKRQGVSAPPPVQEARLSSHRHRPPIDVVRAPEIVPPYPTTFKSENVAVNAADSQPVPSAGTYHPAVTPATVTPAANQQPASVAGSDHTTASPGMTPRQSAPQVPAGATSRPLPLPPVSNNAPAPTVYSATGNGQFASPLAQNIETVEGLQRHSTAPLKEFHARAGTSTQATPNVRLSVQNTDQSRGTYALIVNEIGSSHQFRGEVNHPLAFSDSATHRAYELIVLSIADQQVYGYLRTTH